MENNMQSEVKMLSHNTEELRYSGKTHVMNSKIQRTETKDNRVTAIEKTTTNYWPQL